MDFKDINSSYGILTNIILSLVASLPCMLFLIPSLYEFRFVLYLLQLLVLYGIFSALLRLMEASKKVNIETDKLKKGVEKILNNDTPKP